MIIFTNKKPKRFNGNCLLLTATWIEGHLASYWSYNLYEIAKTEGYNDKEEPCWYWGIFSDGEEWGDYADITADKYSIIPVLKDKKQPHHLRTYKKMRIIDGTYG